MRNGQDWWYIVECRNPAMESPENSDNLRSLVHYTRECARETDESYDISKRYESGHTFLIGTVIPFGTPDRRTGRFIRV